MADEKMVEWESVLTGDKVLRPEGRHMTNNWRRTDGEAAPVRDHTVITSLSSDLIDSDKKNQLKPFERPKQDEEEVAPKDELPFFQTVKDAKAKVKAEEGARFEAPTGTYTHTDGSWVKDES